MTGPHSTAGKNSTADDSSHAALGAKVESPGGGGLVLAGRSVSATDSNRLVRFSRGRRAKRQQPAKSQGRDRPLRRPRLPWSIATKAMAILLLPTLSIAGFAGMELSDSVSRLRTASEVHRLTELASHTTALTDALQAERGTAARILAGNLTAADAGFEQRTKATDRAAADLKATGDKPVRDAIGNAKRAMATLRSLRETVANGTGDSNQAVASYTSVLDRVLGVTDVAPGAVGDGELTERLREIALFARYVEGSEHEAYVVYIAATNGSFNNDQYREFLTTLAEQEANLSRFSDGARVEDRRYVAARLDLERQASYREARNAAFAAGPSTELGLNADEWSAAAGNRSEVADAVLRHLTRDLRNDSSSTRTWTIVYGIGVLAVAALLIGAGIAIALWVARRMTAQLANLRTGAMAVTQDRLPAVIEQLRESDTSGETIRQVRDALPAATEPGKNLDEIDEAKQAAELLGRVAVEVAIRQAELRTASAAMFVNVGRRSQLLVDRLIRLIDKFEQSEHDPDRLSELFQLDHLVTRMRRNDENLLVLAGAESGQRWTRPASLADALRASAAEIELYNRVVIGQVVAVELAAHTVSDVVHLVAELLENATMFAPPRTEITVEARISRGTILIEITDSGDGMPVEQLTELNERLASPHAVAPSASRTMGLYVVAKLAARHGIKVTLQEAEPRGTSAVVSLPATLLHAGDVAPEAAAAAGPENAVAAEPAELAEAEAARPDVSWSPPPRADETTKPTGPEFAPRVPVFAEQPAPETETEIADSAVDDEEQATVVVTPPEDGPRFAQRSHKHWRYGELAENEAPADVTLAIFESIESEWFRETPEPTTEDDSTETDSEEADTTETSEAAEEAEPTEAEPDEKLGAKPKGKRKRSKKSATKSGKKATAKEAPEPSEALETPEAAGPKTTAETKAKQADSSTDLAEESAPKAEVSQPPTTTEEAEPADNVSVTAPSEETDVAASSDGDETSTDKTPATAEPDVAPTELEQATEEESAKALSSDEAVPVEAGDAEADSATEPSPDAEAQPEPAETTPPSDTTAAAPEPDDAPDEPSTTPSQGTADAAGTVESPPADEPEAETPATEPSPVLPQVPKGQTARVIHPVVVNAPGHTAIRGRFPLPTITSAPPRNPGRASSTRPEWHSPSDAGWGRADAAIHPRTGGTTSTGLPKRVPAANYVPGGIGNSSWAHSAAPISRSAGATGQLLSRYRAGLEHARHLHDAPPAGPTQTENPTEL